ncbi:hypothetical protein LPJ56_006922, partial [Coemansia sp. RSA 2599]
QQHDLEKPRSVYQISSDHRGAASTLDAHGNPGFLRSPSGSRRRRALPAAGASRSPRLLGQGRPRGPFPAGAGRRLRRDRLSERPGLDHRRQEVAQRRDGAGSGRAKVLRPLRDAGQRRAHKVS